MKLLVDHQLPAILAAHLRRYGHDCTHVADLGLSEAADVVIWDQATREGAVLVSKDEDFLILVSRPTNTGQLVWVRLGNCRNAALLVAFDRVHDEMVTALAAGRRVFEVK